MLTTQTNKETKKEIKNLTTHTLQMLTTQPKKKRAVNRKEHLQIKKTTSSIWQHTRCKCSQHNQIHFICSVFIFFGCVVSILQHVLSNWGSRFLNLQVFFLFAARFFSFLVVLWAFAACVLSNWRKCFLNLQVFFLFAARYFFFGCVVSICSVCVVKLTKVFS